MKRATMLVLGLVTLALATTVAPAQAQLTANEALVKRFYDAFNARDFAAFDAFISPEVVDRTAAPGSPTGLAQMKIELGGFHAAFSDIQIENQQFLEDGEYVIVRSIARGTHDGPFVGIAPTGRPVEVHAIDIWRVEGTMLVEVWHVETLLNILFQIGAMGAPPAQVAEAPPAPPVPAQPAETGATLWSQAGCFNCHGNLAAGDGDAAYPAGPNIRRSALDRAQLIETIGCGRPGSAMPSHLKGAYTEVACYGLPLGPAPGVLSGAQFSAEQIEILADFLAENVVGKTRITRENCAAFFGGNQNAPMCLQY